MGGGSSSPKYIDQTYIYANDVNTNNQGLINNPPEHFYNYNFIYKYKYNNFFIFLIVIMLILLLLFYFIYKRKKK